MNKIFLLLMSCFLLGFSSCSTSNTPVSVGLEEEVITTLATNQLAAYNRADLDGFCACYHPDVRVFDGEEEKPPGIEAFRSRYVDMFAKGGFGASVPTRMALGSHCVDLEHWWRANGQRGEVLVRYTERDGLIGTVQFFR
jgi:hypothetical protein